MRGLSNCTIGNWLGLWFLFSVANLAFLPCVTILAQGPSNKNAAEKILHLPSQIHLDARPLEFKDNAWQFRIGSTDQTVRAEQILRWGNWRGVIGHQAVWLSDGSWLAGEIQFESKDRVQLQCKSLQSPTIPIPMLRAVLIQPVSSLADWQALNQALLSYSDENDSVWLRDRVRISCRIHPESIVNQESLEITASNQRTKLDLDQVVALVFSSALHGPLSGEPAMTIGLDDGSLLFATGMSVTRDRFELKTQSGIDLASQDFPGDFVGSVSFLAQQQDEKVHRLDQLKPASYRHLPDNTLEFPLGVNKDVFGKSLVVGNRRKCGMIFHGLAVHSSAQVAYRWSGDSARLLSEVRFATNAPRDAHVNCKVLLARGGQLETAQEFQLVQTPDAFQLLDIDITNAQLVVLVVEKGKNSQFGDQVLWLDARIVEK